MTDEAFTRRARKETGEPLTVAEAAAAPVPGSGGEVTATPPDGDPGRLSRTPLNDEAARVPTTQLDDDAGRLPTAQLEMAAFGDHLIPYIPEAPPQPPSVAPWALGVTILALVASLFTGWLLPLGLVAVILSIVSLRRPHDSLRVAVWALALALLSVAFSAGWLVWGFSQLSVV